MAVAAPRLPGLYFQAVLPEPKAVLPHMDIAAFVGLALSGPLHTPVVVEDELRFRDIFGADLPLAWDATSGGMQEGYLGQAVQAFFRNGGRRCWVVRVADASEAQANRFQVPGLVQAGSWQPACARARSKGSWSDDLCVGAVQASQALNVVDFHADIAGSARVYQADVLESPRQLAIHDLLRFTFFDSDLVLFMPLQSISAVSALQRAGGGLGHWFLRYDTASPMPEPIHIARLTPDGAVDLPPLIDVHIPLSEPAPYALDIETALDQAPAPGELLRVEFEDGRILLLPISSVESLTVTGSPMEEAVRLYAAQGYWPLDEQDGIRRYQDWMALQSPPRLPLAERVSFELWVWKNLQIQARMSELAFLKDHARFWGKLPTDATAFRSPDGRPRETPEPIVMEAAEFPRFPLAGPEASAQIYLPLGMPFGPDPALCQNPLDEAGAETRLQRDGLSSFDAKLFLDEKLSQLGIQALMTESNYRHFVRFEPLLGIYSLIPIEEVSLICVPDAVHAGWLEPDPVLPDLLASPELLEAAPQQGQDVLQVTWTEINGATGYLLQQAHEPTFTQPATRYLGPGREVELDAQADCPRRYYYRVRALRNGEVSAWSNTVVVIHPKPVFASCDDKALTAPMLHTVALVEPGEDALILSWDAVKAATGYEMQEAAEPTMESAQSIDVGPHTSHRQPRRLDRVCYFRVRARRGSELGPWSNTRWDIPTPATRPLLHKEYDDGHLLDIQRALLRMCAARGDVFAILTLPAHYREANALAHHTALTWRPGGNGRFDLSRGSVRPLNAGETRALSYGAIYHPWFHARVEGQLGTHSTTLVPPDGAVCGTFAARAITRGAWVAPANEQLADIVSLEPRIAREGWQVLFQAQINLVRQGPRGFFVMSADTLSPERDLRPINVRRLLTLLRRLALREGDRYVFQSNDDALRRLVHHQFNRILADLYSRGAFAGDTPDVAYQVLIHNQINTRQQLEQGRFIVELRVAPSRPLAFITVRLLQTGYEGLTIEEI